MENGVEFAEEDGWVHEVEVVLGFEPLPIWPRGRRRAVTKNSCLQYLKLVNKNIHSEITH